MTVDLLIILIVFTLGAWVGYTLAQYHEEKRYPTRIGEPRYYRQANGVPHDYYPTTKS